MKFDSQEKEILIDLLENKIWNKEQDLYFCEGLESKRYITKIKTDIIVLNRILNKIMEASE